MVCLINILLLSDLHLDASPYQIKVSPEIDAVVLAGDISPGTHGIRWANQHFECPVIYVAGNHEYYYQQAGSLIERLKDAASPHVHVLENEAVSIDGITFLGCTAWTDFSLAGDQQANMALASEQVNDYRFILNGKEKLCPEHTLSLHQASVAWLHQTLLSMQEKPIVVTHHAPAQQSLSEETDLASTYASDLSGLISSTGPLAWLHGHVHTTKIYSVDSVNVYCNARGHHPHHLNTGFDSHFIIRVGQ